MARSYTEHFKRRTAASAGEEPSYLLEISHPQLAHPVRVVNDTENLRRVHPGRHLHLPGSVDDAAEIAVDFDFTKETLTAQVGAALAPVTFTRAGATATRVNAQGLIETVPADTPRFDYDPVTLACNGLLIESARTNSNRNGNAVGSVNGSPGTLPTNWGQTQGAGLTRHVIGSGVEDGIAYVDLRYEGTPSVGSLNIVFDTAAITGIANGAQLASSVYLRLVGGSLANVTSWRLMMDVNDSSNAFLQAIGATVAAPNSTPLIRQRRTATLTATHASSDRIGARYLQIQVNTSTAVDFTVRIGANQAELAAFATSYIPTTSAAVTRNADLGQALDVSGFYNPSEGTLFVEAIPSTVVSPGGVRACAIFNDGTATNRWGPLQPGTGTSIERSVVTTPPGGFQASLTRTNALVAGQVFRTAMAVREDDFAANVNGDATLTDNAGVMPVGVDRLSIGSYTSANFFNGHLRRVTYFPKRLANATLQSISSSMTTYDEEYIACGFRVRFPEDIAGVMPRVPVAIDNVGRELTQWLEASDGGRGAEVRLMQVMRDTPDVVEQEYTLSLLRARQNVIEVTGELGYENVLDQPCLAATYTPETAPGLF